ncbi:MAG: FAD-dependent monooxygenase [Vicingaceae bacterium]
MKKFDLGIIGGGLAGLASAIEMSRKGFEVVLWEKKTYPYHKVCGEYISMEAWEYLKFLGVDLDELNLPRIHNLKVSTPSGRLLEHQLGLGGFGISRYCLDAKLAQLAKAAGVKLLTNCRVTDVHYENDQHLVKSEQGDFEVKLLVGAYGKRSQLDKKWQRKFIQKPLPADRNFTAVKYHIEANLPAHEIGLHLFEGGYCGISKVEGENRYCLCYLTLASSLQEAGGIEPFEQKIMSQNPLLEKYLNFPSLYEKPEVISQINFNSKSKVQNHAFMLGDSAGLIVPLCGNGMSMALHAAHLWSDLAEAFLHHKKSREELEREYERTWRQTFARRLWVGRQLQKLFYRLAWSERAISVLNQFPSLKGKLIQQTHGKPFYP